MARGGGPVRDEARSDGGVRRKDQTRISLLMMLWYDIPSTCVYCNVQLVSAGQPLEIPLQVLSSRLELY